MTLRKQYANSWLVLTARRVGNVLICSGNCCWLSDSAPGSLEAVAVAEEELAPCERELAPCGSGRFGRREALPMASFGWETLRQIQRRGGQKKKTPCTPI